MKRYFITGTNTGCGKTYVTNQLVKQTPNSTAIKPIASGCEKHNGSLVNADTLAIQQATGLPIDTITPWSLELPVSPHIAAMHDGISLEAQEIGTYCLEFALDGIETLFIEGAGGLYVPLNSKETWLEFLVYTKIPVIMVVGMTLGCINHALLTQQALLSSNITCSGWVANCLDPDMLALEENIDTLTKKLHYPMLGIVPYAGMMTTEF